MSLQINNLEELRALLQTTNLEIKNLTELQELLLNIQAQNVSSEHRAEELAALERRQQLRLDYQAKSEAIRVAEKGIKAAEGIGILVPFAAFGAALAAMYFLYDLLALTPVGIAFIGIIWGSMSLVSLLAVIMATATNRKKVTRLLQMVDEYADSQESAQESHDSLTMV